MAKPALDAMKRAGIDEVNKMLTDALLNSELAKTLLMKATPANRPFIAQRLASQVGTLAGSAAANENQRQSQPVATMPAPRIAPRIALPPAPVTGPGLWGSMVPGGALRRARPPRVAFAVGEAEPVRVFDSAEAALAFLAAMAAVSNGSRLRPLASAYS